MVNLTEHNSDYYPVPFYDTNYLINHYKEIKDFFVLSTITLIELEDIKTSNRKSEDVKYKARKALRFLTNSADFAIVTADNRVMKLIASYDQTETPDNIICASAKLATANIPTLVFYTEDLACRMIASHVFKLKVADLHNEKDQIYKGYREIVGTTEEINSDEFWDTSDWHVNEYCICTNTDTGETTEMRFNGHNFVGLVLPPSNVVKGKNPLQRCVLDLLYNKDITISAVLGTYGSGKTYLSTKIGLHKVVDKGDYQKILAIRNPVGHGTQVGYLPGSFDEKTFDFFLPFAQQLDMGEIEFDELKKNGTIDSAIPYYLKGQTFNDTFVIVDEVEDMNRKELKLIGTRLGEGSKIVLCGDYKQSVVNSGVDNDVIDLCNQLKGNPKFACIVLEEDVRSETSKIFAELWD